MFSTLISRVSAALLALGGITLLFAADVVLPGLIPGLPPAASWLGQVLAASWLALAALNWLSQSLLLGGIYGRAVVMTNAAFYFIATTVLLKVLTSRPAPTALWLVALPIAALAATYAWLLYRGPVQRDLEQHRGTQRGS